MRESSIDIVGLGQGQSHRQSFPTIAGSRWGTGRDSAI